MLTTVRYLDLLLLALALPLFLAAGLPLAGWAVGGGAWVAQRALQEYLDRRARASLAAAGAPSSVGAAQPGGQHPFDDQWRDGNGDHW